MPMLWNCGRRQPRRKMEQEKRMKRMAVLVGCNYPDTETQLRGCYNDAARMRNVLVERFGFELDNIELLTDDPGTAIMPTGANIKDAIGRMVDRAEEGDVLYFQYSGHGTLIPASLDSTNESYEDEEAIVPCDFNLITSKDIREIVNRLPYKVSFTVLSDSCHSGGLINNEKEQIGPKSLTASSTGGRTNIPLQFLLPKMIPLHLVLSKLKHLTKMNSSDIGQHLKAQFKKEASLSFRVRQRQDLEVSEPNRLDSAILLSGCQANESSGDVTVKNDDDDCGVSYGAFSHAIQTVLKKNPGRLSNRKVVMMARKLLEEMGFNQHPCLYCTDDSTDAPFLCQPPAAAHNIKM